MLFTQYHALHLLLLLSILPLSWRSDSGDGTCRLEAVFSPMVAERPGPFFLDGLLARAGTSGCRISTVVWFDRRRIEYVNALKTPPLILKSTVEDTLSLSNRCDPLCGATANCRLRTTGETRETILRFYRVQDRTLIISRRLLWRRLFFCPSSFLCHCWFLCHCSFIYHCSFPCRYECRC